MINFFFNPRFDVTRARNILDTSHGSVDEVREVDGQSEDKDNILVVFIGVENKLEEVNDSVERGEKKIRWSF